MAPPPIPVDPSLDSWHTLDPPRTAELDISPLSANGLSLSNDHRTNISKILNNADASSSNRSTLMKSHNGSDIDPNPLLRFCGEKENPWSSQQIGGGVTEPPKTPMDPNIPGNTGHPLQQFTQYGPYQGSPRSEGEGSNPATFPMDSGYGTRSVATRSVHSAGYRSQGYERQSLPGDVTQYGYIPDEQALYSVPPMGQESRYAPIQPPVGEVPMPPPSDPLSCQRADCDFVAKNLAEVR